MSQDSLRERAKALGRPPATGRLEPAGATTALKGCRPNLEEGEEEEDEGGVEEEKRKEGEQVEKMIQAPNIFHLDANGSC